MAGDWIHVRIHIHDDPSVIEMAERLKCDRNAVVGALVKIWGWFDEQSRDGTAFVTRAFLDGHASVTNFCDTMSHVGWLVVTTVDEREQITVPNWDRWNSQPGKKRLTDSKRQRRHRDNNPENEDPVTLLSQPRVTGVSRPSVTRAEQSRAEDNKDNTQQDRVRVLDLLSGEGITGSGAQALYDGGATPELVATAIANADRMDPPPTSRPGYLVSCIRDNYGAVAAQATAGTYDTCCGETTIKRSSPGGNRSACRKCGQWYEGKNGKAIPKAKTENWKVPT